MAWIIEIIDYRIGEREKSMRGKGNSRGKTGIGNEWRTSKKEVRTDTELNHCLMCAVVCFPYSVKVRSPLKYGYFCSYLASLPIV